MSSMEGRNALQYGKRALGSKTRAPKWISIL